MNLSGDSARFDVFRCRGKVACPRCGGMRWSPDNLLKGSRAEALEALRREMAGLLSNVLDGSNFFFISVSASALDWNWNLSWCEPKPAEMLGREHSDL